MYLKQLDIHGFKTFAERTHIVFTSGVTCIVGPNGSGKSNISDAILWVLGETNVRSLRGQTAQDIIFAGNDRRRPLGMAEVSLTIDNAARILPLEFSEITVTRRLYRSSESEFFINKVACRLRDIYELFLDTGVGRDAYSMINQGQIDQILSVRAEDRRAIFEEAAGIKKYRVRKREAERKLEQTQTNLVRVNDIVAELESQLGPLQRQATAARRYRELAVRLRDLENAWYGTKIRRLNVERESLAGLVGELNEERSRLEAELAAAQEGEKGIREQVQRLDGQAEELRQAETSALQRAATTEAERVRAEERAGEVQRRLATLAKESEEVAARIEDQVRRADGAARDEAALKQEVDALRQSLREAQAAAQEAGRAHESAVRELERERQAALERARRQAERDARIRSLEARVQSLAGEQGRAATALEDGEAELERLEAERRSFLKAAAEQKEREQAHAADLDSLRAGTRTAEEELTAARRRGEAASRAFDAHSARLQALSELGERGEGAAAGAKMLLDAARRGYVRGAFSLLIDHLRVPEGLEKAVGAALGPYADALLCESREDALAALAWLRTRKASALVLPGAPASVPESLPGSLAAHLAAPAPAGAWVQALLGRTVVCDSLEADPTDASGSAPTPDARRPTPDLRVTAAGEWISRFGALRGGAAGEGGAAAAALARRRELDRLREEAPALESASVEARSTVRGAEAALRRAHSALRELQATAERARAEHAVQSREADRRRGDAERARTRVERLRADAARIEREQAAVRDHLASARDERGAEDGEPDSERRTPNGLGLGLGLGAERRTPNAQREDEDEDEPNAGYPLGGRTPNAERPTPNAQRPTPNADPAEGFQAVVRRLEGEWRAAENGVTELRVRLAQQEQRLQGASAGARRAAEAGMLLDRQRADRLREQQALETERELREHSFGELADQGRAAQAAVEAARAELARVTADRAVAAGELNVLRGRTQELSGRLRELMERCHRAEVELTAVNTQGSHLGQQWMDAAVSGHSLEVTQVDETLDEPLTLSVEGLLEAWGPGEAEQVLSSCSDPEGEIGRLRRQIRALGPVNPDAVEQHAQARERFDFLTAQRADLEAAREKLEEAIREIDVASRETFMRAFREIADAFDEMFRRLFGGGTTELRLTDPDDVLETGIDVIVQPPGKKQQNLLLLSGGERALTAAAMLFALLKVRPSPFCVMDEVDAPLDESNVGRFTTILRDFSARTQFIVVTHNRGTMEAADTLYGVTMQERGVSKVLSCTLGDPLVAQVEAEQRGGAAQLAGVGR